MSQWRDHPSAIITLVTNDSCVDCTYRKQELSPIIENTRREWMPEVLKASHSQTCHPCESNGSDAGLTCSQHWLLPACKTLMSSTSWLHPEILMSYITSTFQRYYDEDSKENCADFGTVPMTNAYIPAQNTRKMDIDLMSIHQIKNRSCKKLSSNKAKTTGKFCD